MPYPNTHPEPRPVKRAGGVNLEIRHVSDESGGSSGIPSGAFRGAVGQLGADSATGTAVSGEREVALSTSDISEFSRLSRSQDPETRIATSQNRAIPAIHREPVMEALYADENPRVRVAAMYGGEASENLIEHIWTNREDEAPSDEVAYAMARKTRSVENLNEMSLDPNPAYRAGSAANPLADKLGISERLANDENEDEYVVASVAKHTQSDTLATNLARHPSDVVRHGAAGNDSLNHRRAIHLLSPENGPHTRFRFASRLRHADLIHSHVLRSSDPEVLRGFCVNPETWTSTLEHLASFPDGDVAGRAQRVLSQRPRPAA